MDVHPSLPYIFLGTIDGNVEIWDYEMNKCIESLPVYTGASSTTGNVGSGKSKKKKGGRKKNNYGIINLKIDSKGAWLAVITENGQLRIYSLQTMEEIQMFKLRLLPSFLPSLAPLFVGSAG